jgi:hypothetical protein
MVYPIEHLSGGFLTEPAYPSESGGDRFANTGQPGREDPTAQVERAAMRDALLSKLLQALPGSIHLAPAGRWITMISPTAWATSFGFWFPPSWRDCRATRSYRYR